MRYISRALPLIALLLSSAVLAQESEPMFRMDLKSPIYFVEGDSGEEVPPPDGNNPLSITVSGNTEARLSGQIVLNVAIAGDSLEPGQILEPVDDPLGAQWIDNGDGSGTWSWSPSSTDPISMGFRVRDALGNVEVLQPVELAAHEDLVASVSQATYEVDAGTPLSIQATATGVLGTLSWVASQDVGWLSLNATTGELTVDTSVPESISNLVLTATDDFDDQEDGTDPFSIIVNAITSSGWLGWGSGSGAVFGDASTGTRTEASAIGALDGFTDIVGGSSHSCGLKDGAAYCWGANAQGQLGTGDNADRSAPTKIAGGDGYTAIYARNNSTCGIKANSAYCWGNNSSGRLGDGTSTHRNAPTLVTDGAGFTQLSLGSAHTCGLKGTDAYCWGRNDLGSVGNGTFASPVKTPVLIGSGFSEIAAGGFHSCGVKTTGVLCWGYNENGQAGPTGSNMHTATLIAGTSGMVGLAGGDYHTCGIQAGTAYCWGQNAEGALGNDSFSHSATPSGVYDGTGFTSLVAGLNWTCGIKGGDAYCWGDNAAGQLGDGTTAKKDRPVAVVGGESVTSLSAGMDHAFAFR